MKLHILLSGPPLLLMSNSGLDVSGAAGTASAGIQCCSALNRYRIEKGCRMPASPVDTQVRLLSRGRVGC